MRQEYERRTSPNASSGNVVRLAGRASEERERARPAAPEPGERKQPAADEVAREMLVPMSISPRSQPSPILPRVGSTTWLEHQLQPERREALVEHRVDGGLVVAASRCDQAGGRVLEQTFRRPLVVECGARSLRG